jgi:hypothetical protein
MLLWRNAIAVIHKKPYRLAAQSHTMQSSETEHTMLFSNLET